MSAEKEIDCFEREINAKSCLCPPGGLKEEQARKRLGVTPLNRVREFQLFSHNDRLKA